MSNPHDTAENQRSLFKPYVFQPKLLDSTHQSRFSTPAVAVQRREQDEVRLKQKWSPLHNDKYKTSAQNTHLK